MNAAQARYQAERQAAQRAASQRQAMRAQVERACQAATFQRDQDVAAALRARGINATAR
jgi:hypothetical protein